MLQLKANLSTILLHMLLILFNKKETAQKWAVVTFVVCSASYIIMVKNLKLKQHNLKIYV